MWRLTRPTVSSSPWRSLQGGTKRLPASILEQGTYDDRLYALGVMESSVGMYYNKDILEKAGIVVPEAGHPWTRAEFLGILEKLKPVTEEMGGYPLDMTFPVGEASIYYYAPFVWSDGGNLVSEDGLSVDGFSIQMRWRRRWTFPDCGGQKIYVRGSNRTSV